MTEKPKTIYILVLLWLSLTAIFLVWGQFSLDIFLKLPEWTAQHPELEYLISQLNFGYLISTIVWFVFSSLFVVFAYATFRKDTWAWSTGLIISTIFLIIFSIMLAAFMINAIMFLDWFSVAGLVTVVLSFVIDLGIVFFLTRPVTKIFFENNIEENFE
jgi:hypothetical protein